MMSIEEAKRQPATAEINWGELAAHLLTPAQQRVYEEMRLPAWEKYQAAVRANRHNHWTANATIMPPHWNEYRAAVANAFKKAADSLPFEPHSFDSVANALNHRMGHPNGNWG